MEELLEKDMICHYSRNLKKAMVRNSYHGGSLQKDLKHIQRQRNQLVHSWEMKKQTFAQRAKCAKLPSSWHSQDDKEKKDSTEQLSDRLGGKESSAIHIKSDRDVLGRNELVSRQSIVDKEVFRRLKRSDTHPASTALTVKDIHSKMSSDNNSLSVNTTDVQCPSPSISRFSYQLNNLHISPETTIVTRNSSSLSPCPPRPPIQYLQKRPQRARSLDLKELNKVISSSPHDVTQRKRASTWKGKQNKPSTVLGIPQGDSASEKSKWVSETLRLLCPHESV